MMKRLAILATWGWTSLAAAYTPTNWLPEHAAADFAKADAIVVARVIGLTRSVTNGIADIHATFAVARSIRGPFKQQATFTFLIGTDSVAEPGQDDRPKFGLSLFGTHMSYWLEINAVYVLCLSHAERGWEPRSGPQSVFRIQAQGPSHESVPLVVDPRGNEAEARDNVIREVKEAPRLLLEDFLRQRMKTGTPNQVPENTVTNATDSQH